MIKSDQLIDKYFLVEIKRLSDEIIGEDNFQAAYKLSQEISSSIDLIKNYKRDYNDLYREYQDMIIRLRWVGLNILTEDKVIEMFKYNFIEIFSILDFNLWEKLKTVLLSIILVEPRDKYKKQLIQALLDNRQNITSKSIIIDNQPQEPTVSNWLLVYNKVLGTGEVNDLARVDYLVNDRNIQNLNNEEKRRIKFLFDLYERLKLSSQTFTGLENDIPIDDPGKEGIIRNGVFEPLEKMNQKQQLVWDIAGEVVRKRDKTEIKPLKLKEKTNNNLAELKALALSYPPGSLERKVVEEEIEKEEGRSKK